MSEFDNHNFKIYFSGHFRCLVDQHVEIRNRLCFGNGLKLQGNKLEPQSMLTQYIQRKFASLGRYKTRTVISAWCTGLHEHNPDQLGQCYVHVTGASRHLKWPLKYILKLWLSNSLTNAYVLASRMKVSEPLISANFLLKHVYDIHYSNHDNIACWEFRSFPNMVTEFTVAFCIFVTDMLYHTNNTDATYQGTLWYWNVPNIVYCISYHCDYLRQIMYTICKYLGIYIM